MANPTHSGRNGERGGCGAWGAAGARAALVNYTQRLHGVQVGLVNIIRQGGPFPGFPLVNWSF